MIGILNAYHFDPKPGNYQENYDKLILDFGRRTFPSRHVRDYKIAFGDWPLSFDDCEAWLITGSSMGVYDQADWILKLKDFIVGLHQRQKKQIGICFGHQIIAEALGGKVEKSAKGWGVGVKTFSILQATPWMKPPQNRVSLLFSHQDQVVAAPPGAKLLAEDSFCPFQMLQIGNSVLTLQGHPEFSVEFARARLNARREKMNAETYERALVSFDAPRDDQILANWIREFAQTKG